MIILLAILAATRASPVGIPSPPFLSLNQRQAPSCDDPDGCRSLGDIIRSCVLTIFLCTWVSVHPNIPSPEEKWPRITLRRIGLMLATLVVPEAIIAWAIRQRQVAVKLRDEHKGDGWTITHGFFATMGGFMEYKGNEPIRVLYPDQLDSYSLTGNGGFPRIAKSEIEDKSKGDAISKAFVILQTGWFVTQCIARGVQGLPITELELITIAFASLNFIIYLAWWEKPLNVRRGVRVYKKRRIEEPIADDGDVEATVGFWGALGDAVPELRAAFVRGPFNRESSQAPWLFRVLIWPIFKPLQIMIGRRFIRENRNLMRVNTFYPDKWARESPRDRDIALVIAIASVFGGIHCIGWSFTFPSHTERILWLVASASITGVPTVGSPAFFAFRQVSGFNGDGVVAAIIFGSLILYIFGPFALLVLPFLGLRSLPPTAYRVVHWTSFIPHV